MTHTHTNSRKFKKNIFLYITTSMLFCCLQNEAMASAVDITGNLTGNGEQDSGTPTLGNITSSAGIYTMEATDMAGNTGYGGVIVSPTAPTVTIGDSASGATKNFSIGDQANNTVSSPFNVYCSNTNANLNLTVTPWSPAENVKVNISSAVLQGPSGFATSGSYDLMAATDVGTGGSSSYTLTGDTSLALVPGVYRVNVQDAVQASVYPNGWSSSDRKLSTVLC